MWSLIADRRQSAEEVKQDCQIQLKKKKQNHLSPLKFPLLSSFNTTLNELAQNLGCNRWNSVPVCKTIAEFMYFILSGVSARALLEE